MEIGSCRLRRLGVVIGLSLSLSATARAQFDTPCQSQPGQHWPQAGHVLRNLAYGPTPDLLADLADPTAGKTLAQWIQEQLDPASLTEVHPELIGTPPNLYGISLPASQGDLTTMPDLAQHQLIRATFSVRQLLERTLWLWEQVFTTDFSRVAQFFGDDLTGLWLEHAENEQLRAQALGRFKDLLRISATSPTMLVYLDSVKNKVTGSGDPSNENYARELLELHTLGVSEDAVDPVTGLTIYDALDVKNVARVFTGWTVAKKLRQDSGDPFAPAVTECEIVELENKGDVDMNGIINQADVDAMNELITSGGYKPRYDIWPPGTFNCPNYTWGGDQVIDNNDLAAMLPNLGLELWSWSFDFDESAHDYTPKVLFDHNNPKLPKLILPVFPISAGGGSPAAVREGYIVLDHLASSPYTAESICTRLYEYFIADLAGSQAPSLITDGVATWRSSDGDIKQVMNVLFDLSRDLGQQNHYFDKVRTQLEAVVAPVRAFEGDHPQLAPIKRMGSWLEKELGYFLFRYPSPEGFEEKGDQHVSTWKMLQWTRYNQHIWEPGPVPQGSSFPNFQYNIRGILTSNGVDRNNAPAVINFFSRLLYQCNFTSQDHQVCLDFLTTDELGAPITLSNLSNSQYEQHIRRFVAFLASFPQGIQQ